MSMDSLTVASDKRVLEEIGLRFKKKRLSVNISQLQLAKRSGVSRRTVQAIEMGHSISLDKLIALLRGLSALDALENFLPETPISPLMLVKMQGKERQRAYTHGEVAEDGAEYTW